MSARDALRSPNLSKRLAEAEATIEALLAGQIDAVVDSQSKTPLLLAKAQEALRQERDRAQRYLDTPEVILLALDLDKRITLVSRYACSVLGWTADELIGRNWAETCLPPRVRQSLIAGFDHFIAGQPVGVVENPVLTKCGEERLIEWRNTLLRDDADAVIGTFSCGTDITDRRLAELELRKTTADLVERTKTLEQHASALRAGDERTNYALGAAGIGMWELDLRTDQLKWSDSMALLLGFTPEQAPITGEAFFAMIHPEDRSLVVEALQKAERERTDFALEFRVPAADGTTRWIGGHARMLRDDHDGPVSWVGVGIDNSDRRSLEAQFRQSQKMEAVGQLAGGVAHDFNNLLTAILGYSNFVIETLPPEDQRRSDMDEVIKAGQRAATLTRQLLAFSRKQVMQLTIVDLNGLVSGMRQMLSRLIGEQIDLVSALGLDLGPVRADAGQLEQVLMNLVVNARDAMPAGGRLTIETANVELDKWAAHDAAIQPGSYVMLAVSDSGVGMSEATKRRLFEPFFTTKEPGKGTGLGLATVYGIVKQSGGYVWVYSELGQGTTFKVYLPRADDADQPAKSAVVDPPTVTGSETILVVEDEDAVRLLTRRVLESAGYRVFDARNSERAEALFLQHNDVIDMLVTDVIMPGLTGPKLYERLAGQRSDLKVLYVSGYTDDTIVHQGQLDPGIEFLQKPFTADALNRRVREVLDR